MKKTIIQLLFFCLVVIGNTYGQSIQENNVYTTANDKGTALEKALKLMNVNFNLSQFYTATTNGGPIYPVQGAKPTIPQSYGYELSSGNTEINVIFSTIHSILTHEDSECKILANALGEFNVQFGRVLQANKNLFNIRNFTYNRVKGDLRYGIPNKSATKEEIEELDMMVRHCPKEQAQKLFNAEDMIMYPMNLRGNVYEGKYTRSRAVVVSKNGLAIFFYFMMTDESVKNFDKYLNDLGGSFMYN